MFKATKLISMLLLVLIYSAKTLFFYGCRRRIQAMPVAGPFR